MLLLDPVKIIAINKAYSVFVKATRLKLATDFVNKASDHLFILKIKEIFFIIFRFTDHHLRINHSS